MHYNEHNQNIEKESALKFAKKKKTLLDSMIKDYEKKLSKMARAGFSYDDIKRNIKIV